MTVVYDIDGIKITDLTECVDQDVSDHSNDSQSFWDDTVGKNNVYEFEHIKLGVCKSINSGIIKHCVNNSIIIQIQRFFQKL